MTSRHKRIPVESAVLIVIVAMLASCTVRAASEYIFVPSLSVSELHDDNIFFTVSGEESTYITRISPKLDVGFESPRLAWSGSYRTDIERYRDYDELDTNDGRRFADMTVQFSPVSRLTLAADANYTRTNTPVDISLVPGGDVQGLFIGRGRAERTSVHPSLLYRFTPLITGALDYTQTHDEVSDGVDYVTHTATTDIEKKISRVNSVRLGYIYRKYDLDDVPLPTNADSGDDSDTPWLGLSHEISPHAGFDARAGAIRVENSTDPYLLLVLRGQYPRSRLSLKYERNETTVLGDASRQEFEAVSAALSRRFGERLTIVVNPSYTQLSPGGSPSEIFRLAVEGNYRISRWVTLTATFDRNVQEVEFADGSVDDATRNVIQLGIVVTYPLQEGRPADMTYDY